MKMKPLKPPTPIRATMPMGGWTSALPPTRRRGLQASVDDAPVVSDTLALDAIVVVEFGVPSRAQARREIMMGRYAIDGVVAHDPDARVERASVVTRR